METYLAEDILTKTDRMSMAHALEVRCPFLDVRVVESACRMPVGFKLRRGSTKRILRDVAAGIVPEAVLKRPKQGFQIPLGSALKAGLREWSHDLLSSHADSLFHTKEALRLWEAHMDGKADNSRKLWLLLALSEWGNVVKEETAPRM
jgi:asparagine synthase (glutamine-hydrolysing)